MQNRCRDDLPTKLPVLQCLFSQSFGKNLNFLQTGLLLVLPAGKVGALHNFRSNL